MSGPGHEGTGGNEDLFDLTRFTEAELADRNLPYTLLLAEMNRLQGFAAISRQAHAESSPNIPYEAAVRQDAQTDTPDEMSLTRFIERQAHNLMEPGEIARVTPACARHSLLVSVYRFSPVASYQDMLTARTDRDMYMLTLRLAAREFAGLGRGIELFLAARASALADGQPFPPPSIG